MAPLRRGARAWGARPRARASRAFIAAASSNGSDDASSDHVDPASFGRTARRMAIVDCPTASTGNSIRRTAQAAVVAAAAMLGGVGVAHAASTAASSNPSSASSSAPASSASSNTVAEDFETYEVRRVGLMPFQGETVDLGRSRDLQMAFYSEFSRSTPFEMAIPEYPKEASFFGQQARHRAAGSRA